MKIELLMLEINLSSQLQRIFHEHKAIKRDQNKIIFFLRQIFAVLFVSQYSVMEFLFLFRIDAISFWIMLSSNSSAFASMCLVIVCFLVVVFLIIIGIHVCDHFLEKVASCYDNIAIFINCIDHSTMYQTRRKRHLIFLKWLI